MAEQPLTRTRSEQLRFDRSHPLYIQLINGEAIRLLELAPGSGAQRIDIRLCIFELGHCPPFDAISYVWGDESRRANVFCNDRILSITESLAAALHTVRLPHEARLVWADAICINQEDKDEKSHHVAFMRRVYANARDVLICMGSDAGSAGPDIVSLLDSHAQRRSRHSHLASMPVLSNNDATFSDPRWRSLSILMKNVWWTRAWTLQECGMASNPVVLLGQVSINYRALMRLNRWIIACADTLQSIFGIPVETIHSDWEQWTGGFENQQDYPYTVVDFLNQAKCLRCKEPRDHVYAFIGHPLLQKESVSGPVLTVDYNLPVADVFRGLTEWLLSHVGMSVLAAIEHDQASIEDTSTPSWVVRWDKNAVQNSFGYYQPFYYRASLSESPKFALTGSLLSLQCICLSRITMAFQFPRDIATWAVADCPSWAIQKAAPALANRPALVAILKSIRLIATSTYLDTPCQYASAQRADTLSLTLTSGLRNYLPAEDDMSLHRADRKAFWAVFDTAVTRDSEQGTIAETESVDHESHDHGNPDTGSADRYFYDLSLACKGRSFFITDDGHWGMGPWVTQVGDEVMIVQGSRVPFVLRCAQEHGGGTCSVQGQETQKTDLLYRIVGEAYVHGVMRGEAVRDAASWKELLIS
ncbi:hypothetical protein Q7P37_005490 [Cladosporium fusiforme]